jgi:hypothetical protein
MSHPMSSPRRAIPERSRWLPRLRHWLTGPRWWRERHKGRYALARLDDDHLCELSELGQQVRREERLRDSRRVQTG